MEVDELRTALQRQINDPPDNRVAQSQLRKLDEAAQYDAASSYNYLYVELMALKHAVSRGRAITIDSTPAVTLDSVDAFMQWALARYPAFAEASVHDLNLDPVSIVWQDS